VVLGGNLLTFKPNREFSAIAGRQFGLVAELF
jgi:hypothetical protein